MYLYKLPTNAIYCIDSRMYVDLNTHVQMSSYRSIHISIELYKLCLHAVQLALFFNFCWKLFANTMALK